MNDENKKLLKFNVIGAGRCGQTLSYLLHHGNLIQLQGVCNTRIESTRQAVAFIGAGLTFQNIIDLPPADIWLLACPDDQIETVAKKLSQSPYVKSHDIVFHCSGALSSKVLLPLKEKGCFIASLHPMISFSNPLISISHFPGSYCAIEGDNEAKKKLSALFFELGAHLFYIKTDKKTIYHVAGVLSSNYLVSLADLSQECLLEAGVSKDISKNIILSLMNSSLRNLNSNIEMKDALTGPIQRGDYHTIRVHLDAITKPELKDIYTKLGLHTLNLSQISQKMKDLIAQILKKN